MALEWTHGFAMPGSLRKAATDELLTFLPLLRRLPRRLDHITSELARHALCQRAAVRGRARCPAISQLVSRAVLALLGTSLGLISVLLLGLKGGPALSATLGVYQAFGYGGLFISVILILRIVIAIVRAGRGQMALCRLRLTDPQCPLSDRPH